jgi:hypothetical protein
VGVEERKMVGVMVLVPGIRVSVAVKVGVGVATRDERVEPINNRPRQ